MLSGKDKKNNEASLLELFLWWDTFYIWKNSYSEFGSQKLPPPGLSAAIINTSMGLGYFWCLFFRNLEWFHWIFWGLPKKEDRTNKYFAILKINFAVSFPIR